MSFHFFAQLPGSALRMRFSNRFGKKPFQIGALSVWHKGVPHSVRLNGKPTFAIPIGGDACSDSLTLPVEAGDDLEIRLYYTSKMADCNMTEENAFLYSGDQTAVSSLPSPKREAYKD